MGFSLGSDYGLPVPGETLVTATGSTQADAYQIRQQMTVFATVASGAGAILPSSYSANASITVANRGANALLLYPGEGDLIEGNSINAPFTVAAGSQVNLVSFDPPLAASPRTWWTLGLISGVVNIIGGSINGATIGASIPSTGAFTSLTSTSGALNGSLGATTPNTAAILSAEFNGGGSSRLLSYVSGDAALEYSVGGTKKFSVSDTGAVAASSAIFSATLATSAVPALRTGGNIVSAAGAFQPAFNSQIGTVTGTMPSATNLLNIVQTQTDTAATTGEIVNLGSYYTFGGAGFTGARANVRIATTFAGNSTNTLVNGYHRGLAVTSYAGGTDGGTSGTANSNWVGIINDTALLTGAMYWNSLISQEIDNTIQTGASASYLVGLQIVQKSIHAVRAGLFNAALVIANQTAGSQPGYDTIFSFGSPLGVWAPATTLIGTTATALGGPAYAAVNGVDFSAVTFSGDAFKSTNFFVDGTGLAAAQKAVFGNSGYSQGVFDGSTTLRVYGNPTYTTTAASTFYASVVAAGSITSGTSFLHSITASDAINTTTGGSAPGTATGLYVNHVLTAGYTGTRSALHPSITVSGAPGSTTGLGFHTANQMTATATVNIGGTSGAPVGILSSGSFQTTLSGTATYWSLVEGMEGGISVASGLAPQWMNVLKLSSGSVARGTSSYSGLVIGSSGPGYGFTHGICFAPGETTANPIDATTGTLIGSQTAGGATLAANYGIDFSLWTFGTAFLKSTGFSVDGTGLISGLTKATGGTTARTLAAQAADRANVKSFGAVGDGVTVDLTALTAAPVPAFLPAGSYYTGESVYSIGSGRWYSSGGFGRLVNLESGTVRQGPPNLSVITAAPVTNAGYSDNGLAKAFDGDFSRVQYAGATVIRGTATLGQPASGYQLNPLASCAYYWLDNSSGWNNSTSGNSGRTGVSDLYLRFSNSGQGDTSSIYVNGTVSGLKAGATSFLANSAGSTLGGQIFAGAAGVYLQGIGDINLNDGGFDVSGIGLVLNSNRSNGTGALGTTWMAIRPQSQGTVAIDAFYSAGGPARIGFDFTGITLQDLTGAATKSALTLAAGQAIYGNATNTDPTHYARYTSAGTEWLSYETASGWNLVVGSSPVLQASGTAIIASQNFIRKAATADQSADVFVATAAGSRTIPNGCSWECLTPAATIATFTTTMPAAPIDKQEVWISTTNTITTWTLNANAGQSINGAPTTLAANTSVMFRYNLATTAWFRMI